jgi:uncharacterized protein (TIGR00106 family)
MLVELMIIPVGTGSHLSGEIAEALKIIDGSGLPYQLTPTGTCIEGEWDQVMQVVRQCHLKMRERTNHVITSIRIEDEAGEHDKLHRNVSSVEEKLGRTLQGGHRGTVYEARR